MKQINHILRFAKYLKEGSRKIWSAYHTRGRKGRTYKSYVKYHINSTMFVDEKYDRILNQKKNKRRTP
jgi:hypothetical protein